MAAIVISVPFQTIALIPALAIPAPSSPPIRACEPLEGIAASQVMTFQRIAPLNAPKMSRRSTMPGAMMPVPYVWAT
jgi:hypothetical protein